MFQTLLVRKSIINADSVTAQRVVYKTGAQSCEFRDRQDIGGKLQKPIKTGRDESLHSSCVYILSI